MRPLEALALALLVLYVQPALSDTSLLGTLLAAGVDAADCGALGRPCCIRRGPNNRCNTGFKLECCSDGANPRCLPCGGENQVACKGRKCDKGLTVIDRGVLVCVPEVKPLPPKGPKNPNAKGAASKGQGKGKEEADARRNEQLRGRKVGMSACDTEDDCLPANGPPGSRGPRTCIAGICVPCGGPGQACCARAPGCEQFGPGSATVVCALDPLLGTNMCRAPEPEQVVEDVLA